MKKLLFIAMVCNIYADTIKPYSYQLDYGKESAKKSEVGYGVYGSYSFNSFFMEYGLENLKKEYREKKSITQNDITVVYNQYLGKDVISRVGIHYINSGNKEIDKGKIFILGAKKFENDSYDVGIDFYYSSYTNRDDITIMQFSPFFGFYFQSIYLPENLYFKSVYNIITPQKGLNISDNRYFNFSLSNINGDYTTTLSINAFGTEQFSVDKQGFFANTHKDEYENTLRLSLGYKINSNYSLKGEAKIFDFKDEDNHNQAIKTQYSLNLNIMF